MKINIFARVRTLLGRKSKPEAVVVPKFDAQSLANARLAAMAYRQHGPRVARHVARSLRVRAPSSLEGPSLAKAA
jgi:hypothetical protein